MSNVPIPQGSTVDQGSTPASPGSASSVPIPQGSQIDPDSTGYSERLDFTPGSPTHGQMVYTYAQGQKQLDAKHPEMSADEQGNVYYKGKKLEVADTQGLVPTPGIATAARAAAPAVIGTVGPPLARAAGTAVRLARTPIGKVALEYGLKAAAGGTAYAIAKKWLGL